MATVREGTKGVLMVVDLQVGVMREAWDAPRVIANVARAVDDGTRIEAESIVRELNLAMTWLSYPGRSNRVAVAEQVDFAAMA